MFSVDAQIKKGAGFLSRNKKKLLVGAAGATLLGSVADVAYNWADYSQLSWGGATFKDVMDNIGSNIAGSGAGAKVGYAIGRDAMMQGGGGWATEYILAPIRGAFNALGVALTGLWKGIMFVWDKVSGAFSDVWKDGLKLNASTGIVAAVIAVIAGILYWAYRVWKKKSRRRSESYINALSRQSFVEAKRVAKFLDENTMMSKRDCNKVANYVYRNSLNRKLNLL